MLQREYIEKKLTPYKPRPAGAPLALEGVKVLDFSHFLAGPLAAMILGDCGADVVKIEHPKGGDGFRHYLPTDPDLEGRGAPFLWANRNKRSVSLDLKSSEAVELVRRLLLQSDVLIENFSTGVMERLGLDYESCARINPRLIYCSIPAYSRDGEFSDRLGFDTIGQAESGFISQTGFPDREGVRTAAPIMDIGTGLIAGNAILAALVERSTSGQGQYVEVALADSALTMVGYMTMQFLYGGAEYPRNGNTSAESVPTGVYRTLDSAFVLNGANPNILERLLSMLERPELLTDPRFADRQSRMLNRVAFEGILQDIFVQKPWSHWAPLFRQAGVPAGEVRTIKGALESAEVRDRGLVTRVPHESAGWVPNIALPFLFSRTPVADPRPGPALGEHTEEVLRADLGLGVAEIAALRQSGALG